MNKLKIRNGDLGEGHGSYSRVQLNGRTLSAHIGPGHALRAQVQLERYAQHDSDDLLHARLSHSSVVD